MSVAAEWIGAGAPGGAAIAALVVLKLQLRDRRKARRDREEEQARSMTAWLSVDEETSGVVSLVNVSARPVTALDIKIDRGAAGEIIIDHVPVVPPGGQRVDCRVKLRARPEERHDPVPIIEFTDAADTRWRRRGASLERLETAPGRPEPDEGAGLGMPAGGRNGA